MTQKGGKEEMSMAKETIYIGCASFAAGDGFDAVIPVLNTLISAEKPAEIFIKTQLQPTIAMPQLVINSLIGIRKSQPQKQRYDIYDAALRSFSLRVAISGAKTWL